MKIRKGQKFALLRLGKYNDVLFTEYHRAKTDALTLDELLVNIRAVLEEHKAETTDIQARMVIERLLEIGIRDYEK